ncbi:MAG TPA: 30S ribosomal protein S4 [Acidobacteriota bacterium]|nr:30S ribosomal protein S4 [Acidobacteriota bacterium]
MGDPRKPKKRYANPRHPWQKARIEEELVLVKEFSLKNKREIYRHNSQVKRFVDNFKQLNHLTGAQAQLEKTQLLTRAKRIGLVATDKDITAILDMKIRDVLERRLQTLVYKKKLARTMKQARQFITHRHITVAGQVIDAPGFLVSVEDEHSISFIERSALVSEMHPERMVKESKSEKKATETATQEANVEEPQVEAVEIEVPEEVIVDEEKV